MPVGHRDEINPAFFEDTGGDLILGSAAYAYVPGRFPIDLPVGVTSADEIALEHEHRGYLTGEHDATSS